MTEQALYSDGLRNKASKSPMSASTPIAKVSSLTGYSGHKDRDGLVFDTPGGAIYGPKVMLIDDEFASVGTANLDNRSMYLNFTLLIA